MMEGTATLGSFLWATAQRLDLAITVYSSITSAAIADRYVHLSHHYFHMCNVLQKISTLTKKTYSVFNMQVNFVTIIRSW